MSERGSGLTRRNFLHMVGMAGGSAAVHETLVALGLMRHPAAWAGPPRCEPRTGGGRDVVILGAGVGGLATAYWLEQCGYRCTVLEAQDRVGGRSHTARRGDKVFEEDAHGNVIEQQCRFDDDPRLYVNLGPGRIPYHHRRVIDLCERLGVELEVYVHTSDFNLHRMEGMNQAVVRRRLAYDTQGYVSELLAKAINQRALDHELDEKDRDRLLGLLQKFGSLDDRYRYRGSTRPGCGLRNEEECRCRASEPLCPRRPGDPAACQDFASFGLEIPNVKCSCGALERMGLRELLETEFWDPCLVAAPEPEPSCNPSSYTMGFYQIDESLWQTTSFQPVGGMDKIVHALRAQLAGKVVTGAPVTKIALVEGGSKVEVSYTLHGSKEVHAADFCVSNIPLTVLKDVAAPDFSPYFRDAIRRGIFSNACKVGWQANRRFWEKRGIYGGISWIQHPITQMWYPSNDYFAQKGVLTGAYNYARTAYDFGQLSLEKRIDLAWKGGARLHPEAFRETAGGRSDVPKELGISIAWQNVLYQKGCSAVWNGDSHQDELDYESLLVPDMNCRFYVVGDQVSTLPGWQEGALMSAEHVVHQITTGEDLDLERIRDDVERAPMTLDVMG